MKNRFLTLLMASTWSLGALSTANAQAILPPASSTQTVVQSVGIHNISLKYNRPNTNDRKIFGGLIPYNEVWRTGANTIPSISFEEQVSIAGHSVPKGTYGILSIPGTQEWTIILSKNVQQWGAYTYKKEEDVLRFTVPAEQVNPKVESFTMSFDEVTENSTTLSLVWENTKVKFPITVDQRAEIMANIKEAMQGEKKPYLAAAQYYLKNNLDLKQALAWAEAAEKENNKAPYIGYWKAKIQLKAGDKKGAIATAEASKALAQSQNNPEYVKLNTELIQEAKK